VRHSDGLIPLVQLQQSFYSFTHTHTNTKSQTLSVHHSMTS